jgi:hypothetical protein
MHPIIAALLFTACLFVGMLVLLEIGWRIGVRRLARDPEGAMVGVGPVEGAIFGLLALLVAFTFSGATARLAVYRQLSDVAAATEALGRVATSQAEIWTQAVAGSREPDAHPDAAKLLLPALNAMFDITTTRTLALQMHPPTIIFAMLFVVALASALLAGHGLAGGKRRNWLHMVGFAAIIAVVVYVILDLEFPRLGLVRIEAFDQALIDLLRSMK